MGYEARFDLTDARRRRWRGAHTAAGRGLPPLLEPLIAEDGLTEGLDAALDRLPPSARVLSRLGPGGVVLEPAADPGRAPKPRPRTTMRSSACS